MNTAFKFVRTANPTVQTSDNKTSLSRRLSITAAPISADPHLNRIADVEKRTTSNGSIGVLWFMLLVEKALLITEVASSIQPSPQLPKGVHSWVAAAASSASLLHTADSPHIVHGLALALRKIQVVPATTIRAVEHLWVRTTAINMRPTS